MSHKFPLQLVEISPNHRAQLSDKSELSLKLEMESLKDVARQSSMRTDIPVFLREAAVKSTTLEQLFNVERHHDRWSQGASQDEQDARFGRGHREESYLDDPRRESPPGHHVQGSVQDADKELD